MGNFLSINNIAFTILGYPMSYVEFLGTVLYLWSVWLIAKRNIFTWLTGIVSVLLYMFLFYQIRLYSDAIEQVYYLGASIYGWWVWNESPQENGQITDVRYSNAKTLALWVLLTGVVSVAFGFFMSRVHIFLPVIFPEAAAFPYLDALTTIMSFSAMWLMAQKRTESWIYWIIVDMIGIWLYFVKDVKFVAALYGILLMMAFQGLRMWNKSIQGAG
jgi:nicotinamide mononucleotide transporter